ncbi:MAG: hypothetical protein FJ317_04140, partial [SAR202 cluster bacterium]|nr:hypothetical protein [SAR202 cluster bacterium]
AASDFFGNSVGVSRDTAMAGAFGADTGGNSSQGAAYVFALAGPLPVVFVPGVAGSILIDRADGNKVVWLDPTSLSALEDMSLFDPAGDDIVAPDVLREVTLGSIIVEKIYGDFLDGLADKGFREYDLNTGIVGDYASFVPERLTSAGCDSDQTVGGEKPNLFLFPYDWRLDNAVNAQKLNDYIDCVRQFYPDSDVNVVTHSMGSLLTRRYVLDNPGEHHVSRWVSIGAPWLGAPKLAYVLETGEFVPELAGIDTVTSILKDVLGSFHAAHQLLPSKAYFELGAPATILEFAVDMDGNGEKFDSFASDALYDLVDARYGRHGFTPGTTAKNFHTAAQDDWRTDSSGIEYFHIIGVKSGATTIARFTGHMETVCEVFTCSSQFVAVPRFTVGDGTVPRLSAERIGNSLNYNAPDATRLVITSPAPSSDGNVDHNGMMNYSETTRIVLDVLAGGDGSGDAEPFPTNIGGGSVDYHYVKLIGPASITVLSGSGGSTAALNGVVAQTIPGIEVLSIGENAFMALIPAGLAETYDLKFFAPGGPIRIEVLTGDGGTPDAAIRYADLVLPEGATSTLAFSLTGVANLAYDSDGNGTLDATAAPTANLTGAAAADAEGPVISVSQAFEGGLTQVTLSATDAGSGVAGIFFSTDGAGFEEYTGPFTVNPSTVPTIYAFANDNAANRSTLVQTLAPPPAPVPGPTT